MTRNPYRRGSGGFTLVELLVVIAIIAILAAILFPVFARARAKAYQTTCVSNLRQLSNALAMYQSDYEGYYPAAQANNGNGSAPVASEETMANWAELVYPYVKSGQALRAGKVTFTQGIFHCPADSGTIGPSYGINGWVLFGLTDASVQLPTNTVILAERPGAIPREHFVWWQDPWPTWPISNNTPITDREAAINAIDDDDADPAADAKEERGLQTLRHDGGSNWLLADGHAKWAKLAWIWGNGTTTNQLWPTRPQVGAN